MTVTRWQPDATRDHLGNFYYLRDPHSGTVWSTSHQPTRQRGRAYEAIFSERRAELRHRDGDLELHTDTVVSPEDDIELRRVRITNLADHARAIELISYAYVVLAPAEADALHLAFSMRQINAVEADAQLYARLANAIPYGHGSLRAEGSLLMQNRRGQSGLWGYAISGDLLLFFSLFHRFFPRLSLTSQAAVSRIASNTTSGGSIGGTIRLQPCRFCSKRRLHESVAYWKSAGRTMRYRSHGIFRRYRGAAPPHFTHLYP